MAYAQIHTAALSHPKILALSAQAFRIWVAALCYAQEHLTDGALPRSALVALCVQTPKSALAELEHQRLWEATVDGWQIHDYSRWNKSRTEVEEKRAYNRQRLEVLRANRRNVVNNTVTTPEANCRDVVPPLTLTLSQPQYVPALRAANKGAAPPPGSWRDHCRHDPPCGTPEQCELLHARSQPQAVTA